MKSRLGRLIPLGIIGGAFAVRLAYVIQTKDLAPFYHPFLDTGFFHELANFKRNIAWADATLPFREPLYGYLVAALYSLFRESLTLVRVVQVMFGSISVGLTYLIARRTYGEIAGVLSGCLLALYIPSIFFVAELNETTTVVMLILLSLYLLVRMPTSTVHNLSSGLLLGLASLGRLTAMGVLPGWLAYIVTARPYVKRNAIMLIIGFAIPPFIYQAITFQGDGIALLPLRSGWQAFLAVEAGDGIEKHETEKVTVTTPDGTYPVIVSTDRLTGQRDATRLASVELGKDVSGGVANWHWWARASRILRERPAASIKAYFRRMATLLGASQPPTNFDMRLISRFSSVLRTHFSFVLVAPLGLAAFATLRKRETLAIALSIVSITVISSLFPIGDIDKLLLACLVIILAGSTSGIVIDSLIKHNFARSLRYVIGAIGLGIVIMLLPRAGFDEPRQVTLLGDLYADASLYDKAEENYKQAMAADPDLPEAYLSLARLYGNAGKSSQALAVLDRALARGLDDPRLQIERASLLVLLNRSNEVKRDVMKLQSQYPLQPRVHELMGLCLLAEKDPEAAIVELEKEIQYCGGGFVTYAALGRAYFSVGNYSQAATCLEQALGQNPLSTAVTSLAIQLADAYTRLGYHYKACDVLSRIARIDPGNMPVRFKLANCLYRAGRLKEAIKQFDQLHKFDPSNADILVNLGTVYAEMDSLDVAVQMWKQALEIDPNNEMARQNLKEAGW